LSSYSGNEYVFYYHISEVLRKIFEQKGVLLLRFTMNSKNSADFLDLEVFYQSKSVSSIKNTIITSKNEPTCLFESSLDIQSLFKKYDIKKNYLFVRVINYNKRLNRVTLKMLYDKFKVHFKSFFSRRITLFVDFLKITYLFMKFDKPNYYFLHTICEVFRVLTKKHHSRYMMFVKSLLNYIISCSRKRKFSIIGLKLVISGKLKGKPRSSLFTVNSGSVPLNTVSSNISFEKMHSHTLYGVFGFKLWIHRKPRKSKYAFRTKSSKA
jgi:hypothetical protein